MTTVHAPGVATGSTWKADVAAQTAAGMDERRRARIAGLALVASPILWLVGAAVSNVVAPQLGGFYGRGDPVTKVNALVGQQVPWTVQSLLFFGGTLAAVVGLALLAQLLWHTRAAALARAGLIGLVAVLGLNAFALLLRLTAPMQGVRDMAEVPPLLMAVHSPGWLGVFTTVLTVATVALLAAALFWSGRAKLTGGGVAALSGLLLVVILAGGPPPPVLVYPIAALLGVRLLFWGTPAAR